jgi:hypothetical protein
MLFEITFAIYLAMLGVVAWEDLKNNKDIDVFKA